MTSPASSFPRPAHPAGARLAATGFSIPNNVVTNDDLSKTVDTNDEWISKRTGIKQRHIAKDGETCRTLATGALKQAINNANILQKDTGGFKAADLDMVILASLTPDMLCPTTAAQVTADVGAVPAAAVDINAACSGFVYGMNMASALIATGFYKNIAVIGAEVLSKITDWKDRGTCVLFGDGAGAAIFSASDDASRGCIFQSMASNGEGGKELYIPRCEDQIPPGSNTFTGAYDTLQMNGKEVFKFAVSTLQSSIEKALEATGLSPDDITAVIPHQSNARILEAAREKLGMTTDKFIINIDRYGNTSAASVPICLHEMVAAGRVKPGDLVLFVALGGGLTWASSLWRV